MRKETSEKDFRVKRTKINQLPPVQQGHVNYLKLEKVENFRLENCMELILMHKKCKFLSEFNMQKNNHWKLVYIPLTYLLHTSYIPLTYLLHTSYIPLTYLLHTSYIPLTYLLHTSYIPLTYLLNLILL